MDLRVPFAEQHLVPFRLPIMYGRSAGRILQALWRSCGVPNPSPSTPRGSVIGKISKKDHWFCFLPSTHLLLFRGIRDGLYCHTIASTVYTLSTVGHRKYDAPPSYRGGVLNYKKSTSQFNCYMRQHDLQQDHP